MKIQALQCASFSVILAVVLSATGRLSAQTAEATPKPTPPPGPLVQERAPDFASWTVVTEKKKASGADGGKSENTGEPEDSPATKGSSDSQRTVTRVIKTGALRFIETTGPTGRSEVWSNGGWQVTKRPEWKELVVSNGENSADTAWVNYSAGDFPGFQWLSPTNYLGIFKFKGRDCLVFRDRVQMEKPMKMREFYDPSAATPTPAPVDPETLKVSVGAYIDLETRLPILLIDGEKMSTYGFDQPPTAPLVFPPDVKTALTASVQKIQTMLTKPARP